MYIEIESFICYKNFRYKIYKRVNKIVTEKLNC